MVAEEPQRRAGLNIDTSRGNSCIENITEIRGIREIKGNKKIVLLGFNFQIFHVQIMCQVSTFNIKFQKKSPELLVITDARAPIKIQDETLLT